MRAWLVGGRSDDPKIRALSNVFGEGYMGAAFGEAGIQTYVEELFKKQSHVQDRMRAIQGTILEGEQARKLYGEIAAPPATNPQEALLQQQDAALGTQEAMKWSNVRKAREGALIKLVQQFGDIEGTGALQQTLRNLRTRLSTPGMTDEELYNAQIEEARKVQEALIDSRDPLRNPDASMTDFVKWMRKTGRIGQWTPPGRLFLGPKIDEYQREWQKETMGADKQRMFDALEMFINEQERVEGGRQSYERTHPEGLRTRPEGQQPAGNQSSMINQLLDRVDRLALVLENMQINVTVEDGIGRRIGYQTSRPLPLELLSEQALG